MTTSFLPKYSSKEELILFCGLSTCDPGDIFETIEQMKKENIKCNVIGIGAEVYICKAIAQKTGGNNQLICNLHGRKICCGIE